VLDRAWFGLGSAKVQDVSMPHHVCPVPVIQRAARRARGGAACGGGRGRDPGPDPVRAGREAAHGGRPDLTSRLRAVAGGLAPRPAGGGTVQGGGLDL